MPTGIYKHNPSQCFQKGHPAYSGAFKSGEKHLNWKGDKVGYDALHDWVNSRLGKPDTCSYCGRSGLSGRQIHWANKSGDYKRDLTDWVRLC